MPKRGDPVRGLPESVFEVDFAKGISEHEDKWLQSEGFTRLENCEQDKFGAVVKTPGFARFNGLVDVVNLTGEQDIDNSIQSGIPKAVQRGDQIGIVSDAALLAKAEGWHIQGRVSPWVAEQRTVVEMGPHSPRIDCCRSGDWSFTVWEADDPDIADTEPTDHFRVSATYLPTGETIVLHEKITAAEDRFRPRLVPWDNTGAAILFYVDVATTTTLYYRKITPDAVGAEQTLETVDDYPFFDAHSDPDAARAWVVWCVDDDETAGTWRVRRYTIGASTLTGGPSRDITAPFDLSIPMPSAVAIVGDHGNNRVTVAWWETEELLVPTRYVPHLRAIGLQSDPSAAEVWSERDIHVGNSSENDEDFTDKFNQIGIVSLGTPGGHYIVWTDENQFFDGGEAGDGSEFATDRIVVRGKRVSPTGTVDTEVCQCGLVRLRSRPAWDGTRVFFLAEYAHQTTESEANRHHYILAINPIELDPPERRFRPMGHFGYLVAGLCPGPGGAQLRGVGADLDRMSSPFQDANGGWHFQGIEISGQGAARQAVREYVLFQDERAGVSAELGAQTYIAGALVSAWDGLRVLEAGFLHEPFFENGSGIIAGGDLPAGVYRYKLTYARFSASGEVLRSAPSAELAVTSDGTTNQTTQILTQGYIVTNQMATDNRPVYLEIWRTEANETEPFRLVNRVGEDNLQYLGLDPNDREQVQYPDDLVNFVETAEQLYSTGDPGGGELPNHPPTSALSICRWRNRLLITDGDQILYTKEGVPNRAAEFNRSQAIERATRQKLTAVAPLGEIFVLFGEDETAFIYGDGPGADGTGAQLVGPSILNDQVGCTQPAGLCIVPGGLIVPTRQGVQFLSLGREYAWIGGAIEDTLETYPLIRDVRMHLGENRVWFCLSATDRESGIFAVHDLTHRTWSRHFPGATGPTTPATIVAVGEELFWASSENTAWYERTPTDYLFNADEYQQTIETPWFKPAGPNGEIRARRLWLLLERLEANTGIKIEFGFDFANAYSRTLTFTSAELGAVEGPQTPLRVSFPRQRCTSFRLRISTNVATDVDSAGIRFVSLRLAVALRKGKGRLLAARNAAGTWS